MGLWREGVVKKLRNSVVRAAREWAPYVGVLLVFAGFLAFVSWDVRRQQEVRRTVGLVEAREGEMPAEVGREGLVDEAERERLLRERLEQKVREEEERLKRLWEEAPPHDAERSTSMQVVLKGLNAPHAIALSTQHGGFFVSTDGGDNIWRAEGERLHPVLDANTPIQRGSANPQPPLERVADFAIASRDRLVVVEGSGRGRLLAFHLDADGRALHGEPIDVPGLWEAFDWTALAAAPDGRLLLGASNRERVARTGNDLEVSVLLYRDDLDRWWILHERLSGQIGSVAFSKSGEQAIYRCATSGVLGWVDLRTTRPTGGTSRWRARDPGSVAVLPNGALLVAESGGRLWSVDPGTDNAQILAEDLPPLGGALWDRDTGRILALDREAGRVLEIALDPGFNEAEDRMVFARYEPLFHLVHVPERPPDYLAQVLALGGFRSSAFRPITTTFREFAQRVPLVSAEALALPLGEPVDPIRYLQFVVFDTDRILDAGAEPSSVLAAFHARTSAGTVIRTSALPWSAEDPAPAMGIEAEPAAREILVPNAASMQLSAGGIATLHLRGYGHTPDFSITLDPLHDGNSSMSVYNLDGSVDEYQLQTPRRPTAPERWVMAASYQLADQWKRLDASSLAVGPGLGARRP